MIGDWTVGTRKLATVKAYQRRPRSPNAPTHKLATAIDKGEREILVALREKLAKQIDACNKPTTLAPLVRQFRDCDAKIRAMDERAEEEVDEDDDGGDSASFSTSAI